MLINTMKVIPINNKMLPVLHLMLIQSELDEKQTCARRRFCRDTQYFIDVLNADRTTLQLKYCDKGLEDQPILDKDNKLSFTDDNKKAFDLEWVELNNKVLNITVGEHNGRDIETIITILKNEQSKYINAHKENFTKENEEFSAMIEQLTVMVTPIEI